MLIPSKTKTVEEIIEENFIQYQNKINIPSINQTTFIIQYDGIDPLGIILLILKADIGSHLRFYQANFIIL